MFELFLHFWRPLSIAKTVSCSFVLKLSHILSISFCDSVKSTGFSSLKNCDKVTISDEKLYYYRYREGSAVNNTRLDKYRSKYEVMKKIKEQDFSYTKQSRKKTSFLYFETMFSYLNQVLIRDNKSNKLEEILSSIDVVELLKQKNIKLFLKFVYLKAKR